MWFKNVNLIDGTDNGMQPGVCMEIKSGIIKQIIPEAPAAKDDVIDLQGKYIIPGLIDCHVHINFPATADPETTVRNFAEADFTILAIKNLEKLLESKGIKVVRLTPEARAEFRALSGILYEKGPVPAPLIAEREKAIGK